MLSVYLFATVAGTLLLGASLLSGGGQHALPGSDLTDGDDHGGEHGGGGSALLLLSLQLWSNLLCFGGATGLLLSLVAHLAEPLAGICALGVGAATALGGRRILQRLAKSSDSGTVQLEGLVGSSALVLVPAAPGAVGKVRLSARGQTVDLLARAESGRPLLEGAEVVIIDVEAGVATVTSEPALSPKGGAKALPARLSAQSNPQSSKG